MFISPILVTNIVDAKGKNIVLVNPEQLTCVAVSKEGLKLNSTRIFQMVSLINAICPKYGITTVDIFEEFLATILHESQCFRYKSENLNYTHAETIFKTWPKRFKNVMAASIYVKKPVELGNFVYRLRNGNKYDSDGYNMRGAGFIQATGREILNEYFVYKQSTDPLNTPATLEETINKVRADDGWALDSSCWVYCVKKKLIGLSIDDRFVDIEKVINGGTIGMDERVRICNLVKQFLPNLN